MAGSRILRKHLSADALVHLVRSRLAQVPETRSGKPSIPLVDALMSAYALFTLKDPSLLAFDKRRHDANLRSLFHLDQVPCDTQMRTILDPVPPEQLRPVFRDVFRQLQRGQVLKSYVFLQDSYLLSLDGTGYFSSEKIHCPSCLEKHHQDGTITYHHQLLGAAIVYPGRAEVIALAPEPIIKQDGQTKNDCERNAARRFLKRFRREHPHLSVIVVEDGLSANGPHVEDLRAQGCHFILGVQEGDHEYLFEEVRRREDSGEGVEWVQVHGSDPQVQHHFAIVRDVPLNESHPELRVTFVRYVELNEAGEASRMFTWITELEVTAATVWRVMLGGRARWKIENETFNTLKNQGYHFEHNYGHGAQHLSVVLALLMMLAFLVDQTQQLCDPLFRAAWEAVGSKRLLWERQRSLFYDYRLGSFWEMYEALAYGLVRPRPVIDTS